MNFGHTTQPTLIWGVPKDAYYFIAGIPLIVFVFSANMLFMLLGAPIMWLLAFILSKNDPDIFGIIKNRYWSIKGTLNNERGKEYRP